MFSAPLTELLLPLVCVGVRVRPDVALEEYNRTHPDVSGFQILERPSPGVQVALSPLLLTWIQQAQ